MLKIPVSAFNKYIKSQVMLQKSLEVDQETSYKETFRVFSKDEEGCIPAEEIK